VVLLEADRSGGSLAAWLDTPAVPSLSNLVTTIGRTDRALGWADIDPFVRRSRSGVRFVAAPVRSREAAQAIAAADRSVVPMLARLGEPEVLADVGRWAAAEPVPASLRTAHSVVVVHGQELASAAAATVRVDRLAETVAALTELDAQLFVGVVGDGPFDIAEIADFVDREVADRGQRSVGLHATVEWHSLARDPLAAAVLAGRAGVSGRRLARLPLMRSVRPLAARLVARSDEHRREKVLR